MNLVPAAPAPTRDRLRLLRGRMHEAWGPSELFFALAQATRASGKIVVIQDQKEQDQVTPAGTPSTEHMLYLMVRDDTEALAVTEDCMRSTSITTVIASPRKPLTLTQGRRLQLAAAEGNTIGITVIQEGAGCHAAETRWHCRPLPADDGGALHEWRLEKDKKGPEAEWNVIVDLTSSEAPWQTV